MPIAINEHRLVSEVRKRYGLGSPNVDVNVINLINLLSETERDAFYAHKEADTLRATVTQYADALTMVHAGLPEPGLDSQWDRVRTIIEATRDSNGGT